MADKIKIREVRSYIQQDKEQVLRIIERVWGKEVRDNHCVLWDWKHLQDEKAESSNNIAQVIETDGKIVGYTGAIPAKIKLEDKVVEGILCMDTFVDPDSLGAGLRLMKHQLKEASVIFGAATLRTKDLWSKLVKIDNTVIKEQIKMICPVDPTEMLTKKGFPGCFVRLILWCWRLYFSLVYGQSVKYESNYSLYKVNVFPEDVDILCSEFSKEYKYMVIRDHKWLNWRFVESPVKYEKFLLHYENKILGYMVYRVIVTGERRVLILLEILSSGSEQDNNYKIMLSHLLKVAKEERVSDIQTLDSGSNVLRKILEKSGFCIKKKGETPIIGYVNKNVSTSNIYADKEWFLTLGDCDFEFIFFKHATLY